MRAEAEVSRQPFSSRPQGISSSKLLTLGLVLFEGRMARLAVLATDHQDTVNVCILFSMLSATWPQGIAHS